MSATNLIRERGMWPTSHPALGSTTERLRHYLADLVYGANDGIITTFAIVAGVAGAELSAVVVLILGVANLVADGLSMAASNYLAIRSRGAVERAERRDVTEPFATRHAAATFLAFVSAGSVPLAGFLLPLGTDRFATASLVTLLTLFCVGASRSLVTLGRWWRDGLEMLAIGALAAAVAFGTGRLLAVLIGVIA